jgi:hypothetical protein
MPPFEIPLHIKIVKQHAGESPRVASKLRFLAQPTEQLNLRERQGGVGWSVANHDLIIIVLVVIPCPILLYSKDIISTQVSFNQPNGYRRMGTLSL